MDAEATGTSGSLADDTWAHLWRLRSEVANLQAYLATVGHASESACAQHAHQRLCALEAHLRQSEGRLRVLAHSNVGAWTCTFTSASIPPRGVLGATPLSGSPQAARRGFQRKGKRQP